MLSVFSLVTLASAHEMGKPHTHKKHAKKSKTKEVKKDDAAAAPVDTAPKQ